jgi:hypothetical protein
MAIETSRMHEIVPGNQVVSYTPVFKSLKRFSRGCKELEDDPRSSGGHVLEIHE